MFSSINGYGGVRPAALQGAGGPNALSKVSNVQKTDAKAKDAQQTQQKQPTVVDKPAVLEAVKKLNETVAPALQTLEFDVDEDTEQLVVKVRDKETKEVIRQMPSEEALEFSKTLDRLQGLVIRQTA